MNDSTLLVRGAQVLTMDARLGDIAAADVLVRDGLIARVDAASDASAPPSAQVIDARGMLMIPGLIDTHTHMWQAPLKGVGAGMWGMGDYNQHVFPLRERLVAVDMEDATFACGVEMLDNGITAVLDFCHNTMSPAHAPAALRAHRATGQRVLFCYGMLGRFETLKADHGWRLQQVRELAAQCASDGLVRFGLALGSLEFAGMELFTKEARLARELGLPLTFHQNVAGQVQQIHEQGLLAADMLPVHCNPILDHEIDLLAQAGCGISFTPESEIGDGRDTSVMSRALKRGVSPSLGGDVPSRVALDLFSQMKIAFFTMRAYEAAQERLAGRWPLTRYRDTPHVQPRHMLECCTVNAARALGLGDRLGRIAPGCHADFVLLRQPPYAPSLGDPAAHVVLQAGPADVHTVAVGGRLCKRAGELAPGLRESAARAHVRVRDRLFAAAPHTR